MSEIDREATRREIEWRVVDPGPTWLGGYDLLVNGVRMGAVCVTSHNTAIGYAGEMRLGHFENDAEAKTAVLRSLGLREKLQ